MTTNTPKPGPNHTPKSDIDQNAPQAGASEHEGVHKATPQDPVQSRSDDPGQSSYGGFKNEDPRKQAQDVETPAEKGEDIAQTISGNQPKQR